MTETKFVISGFAASPADPVNGSLLVSAFNPSTQQILRLKMSQNSQALTLPNGLWYFSVIYWDDSDPETATTLRCGITKEELIGENISIDLSVTAIGCADSNINPSNFYDGFALQDIELNQCSNIGSPGSNCSSVPGLALSARIVIPAINLSNVANPTYNTAAGSVISGCINLSTGTANLGSLIPGGSTNMPFPFTIRTYSAAGCIGGQGIFNFNAGLLTTDSANQRIVDVTAATPDFTRIMLLTNNTFAASVPTLNVPGESQYTTNVAPFISGGTPPYSFTMAPAIGSMTSDGLFTPANTSTTYTVTVRDATTAQITFTMQTHLSVFHTRFFDSILGNWGTFRASDGVTMPSASVYNTVGIDDSRFLRTTLLDRYLLTEQVGTNYVLHSSDLGQGVWTPTATTSSLTADPINPGNISRLQKNSISSSYATQSISHPATGTHTVSAFFKAGSSTYAVLTDTNGGVCHGVHLNLTTGEFARVNIAGCNGAFTLGSFGAENIGNGWWRAWFRKTISAGTSAIKIYPAWGSSPLSENTGSGLGSDILIYNVQVEASSVLTSPIETTSATGTRALEYHMNTLDASAVGINSATILLDYHPLGYSAQAMSLFTVCDGSNRSVEISRNVSGTPVFTVFNGATSIGTVNGPAVQAVSSNRLVASIGTASLKLTMRGQPVTSATKGTSLDVPDSLRLGNDCSGSPSSLGVRRVGYWNAEFHELILQQMSNGSN